MIRDDPHNKNPRKLRRFEWMRIVATRTWLAGPAPRNEKSPAAGGLLNASASLRRVDS